MRNLVPLMMMAPLDFLSFRGFPLGMLCAPVLAFTTQPDMGIGDALPILGEVSADETVRDTLVSSGHRIVHSAKATVSRLRDLPVCLHQF